MGFQAPSTIRPEDVLPGTLNPGVVLEGNTVRTGPDPGQRTEMTSVNGLSLYSGLAAESGPGRLAASVNASNAASTLTAPSLAGGNGSGASLILTRTPSVNQDQAELKSDRVALTAAPQQWLSNGVADPANPVNTIRLDANGRLYKDPGTDLSAPEGVVLASTTAGYRNSWAAVAGTRGFWSYLGPDGFVTMGGRGTGAAINQNAMVLPGAVGSTVPGLNHLPAKAEDMYFACTANNAPVVVRISPGGGVVQLTGTPTNLSLDGIRFPKF